MHLQTPRSKSQEQLNRILEHCENYVGMTSEAILNSSAKTEQINKTTVTIKMRRYSMEEGCLIIYILLPVRKTCR